MAIWIRLKTIRQLDGKSGSFGLGGMDMYIYAKSSVYYLDSKRFFSAAGEPLVDGSGLKNT